MRVKFFYRNLTTEPGALQLLEDDVNAFLQTLDSTTTNPLLPQKIQVGYLNDHQSNVYAMVSYG